MPSCEDRSGDEWMNGWIMKMFMAYFDGEALNYQGVYIYCVSVCIYIYINDDGVDYRDSTCHPIRDTEIHTPKTILTLNHNIHDFY